MAVANEPEFSITPSFQDAVGITVSNDSKPLEWGGVQWTEPWGDRNFILLKKSEDLHEPDLWIGNIGVSELAPVTHFADRAREFVKLAAFWSTFTSNSHLIDRAWGPIEVVLRDNEQTTSFCAVGGRRMCGAGAGWCSR